MRARLARFRDDRRGLAAIEFGLVLPVLLAIYFGTVELSRVADTSRKLTLFTRTLADLSGRADNPSPSASAMATIAGAASAILWPLNVSSAQIVVSAMGVESIGGTLYGGVCSSWSQNAAVRTPLTINGTSGLPATPAVYQYAHARYMLAEVSMAYTPIIGANLYKWIFGTRGLTFSRQVPWAERTTNEIVMPGGSACPYYN